MPGTVQELRMIDDFQHVSITCRDWRGAFASTKPLDSRSSSGSVKSRNRVSRKLSNCRVAISPWCTWPVPKATGKMFIDLVQWLEPPSTGEPYPALNHVGLNRIVFRVSDIDATTAALQERGITFLSREPQTFGQGIRSIVTTDPDGVFIQLIEGL